MQRNIGFCINSNRPSQSWRVRHFLRFSVAEREDKVPPNANCAKVVEHEQISWLPTAEVSTVQFYSIFARCAAEECKLIDEMQESEANDYVVSPISIIDSIIISSTREKNSSSCPLWCNWYAEQNEKFYVFPVFEAPRTSVPSKMNVSAKKRKRNGDEAVEP